MKMPHELMFLKFKLKDLKLKVVSQMKNNKEVGGNKIMIE